MGRVPFAHPDYGTLFINCNINYNQFGDMREIVGDVELKDMDILYEAKFLDADYDPDIIVVTRRGKMERERLKKIAFFKIQRLIYP